MENQRIFFSKKNNIYYYVTYGEFPNCNICHKEISRTLVYHTSWRKNSEEIRTYHIGCYQKISSRGLVDEFKTCAVIEQMPEEAHPVFERTPVLANANGASTFEVSKILKGSEAEVKDKTRVSKNQKQYLDPYYEKNQKMFKKKEEELGHSIFLLQDLRRDELLQIEHEKKKKERQIICKVVDIKEDSIDVSFKEGEITIKKEELPISPDQYQSGQEVIARIKNGDKKVIASLSLSLKNVELSPRKRVYSKENEIKEVNIHDFLKEAINSQILLPHQDPLELSYSKDGQKFIGDKP